MSNGKGLRVVDYTKKLHEKGLVILIKSLPACVDGVVFSHIEKYFSPSIGHLCKANAARPAPKQLYMGCYFAAMRKNAHRAPEPLLVVRRKAHNSGSLKELGQQR